MTKFAFEKLQVTKEDELKQIEQLKNKLRSIEHIKKKKM